MKFLQTLIEDSDHDIFDDLLDDLGAQGVMGAVANARNKGVSWNQIVSDKETYEEEGQAELTDEEWAALIRVLKAGGQAAKMVGLEEEVITEARKLKANETGQINLALRDAKADIEFVIELINKKILVPGSDMGKVDVFVKNLNKTAKQLREAADVLSKSR